jgi:hypothetical protein
MATIQKPKKAATKAAPKMVPGEMTGKMYKKSEIDEIGRKQAAELDKSGVFGKAAMAKKKTPKAEDGLKTRQYKRLGRIDEKNSARAERVADRMKTKASRVERGKEIANPSMSVKRFNMDLSERMKAPKAKSGKEMIKRADGSYSQRGLWDNIRAAKGSGKKPTAAMLKQEKKIKAKTKK